MTGGSYKKLAVLWFLGGLAWAFCSDALISVWAHALPSYYLELLRGGNNLIIFIVTAFIFYRRVRKQQYRLIRSEKQYRNLFDSNPNPMWIYDKGTLAFIAINDAAVVKYGYSRDEFLKMTIRDIRPAEDNAPLDATLKNDSHSIKEVGLWRHIRKSGEIFTVSIVSHPVWFDRRSCNMVMATDVTAIVHNEKMLREAYLKEKELSEELAVNYELIRQSQEENRVMAHVIDKINNLVLIVKEDGLISWCNRAFTDFTGYPLNEIAGRPPREILPGPQTDPETIARLRESVNQKAFFSDELINYKKNGEPYWTQLTISPIYNEDGNFQFFMSVETVITERKEKEQKILAQHVALQKVAWSNSHELRRPVCTIIGLVAVLKDADNEKDRDHCLTALEKCARELDDLVRQINQKIDRMELEDGYVQQN
ncbi:MAG TPA: PAS domain-containing protein [Mucilaginibacter sp.]